MQDLCSIMSKMTNWWQDIKGYSKREKLLSLFIVILSVVSLVFLTCLLASRNEGGICYTRECIIAAHHVITTVDDTVDPCDDFYKFVCGNFLKNAIANDQVSPLKALDESKKNILKQLVMEDRKDEDTLIESFRDQRKFFRACMNTSAIEADEDRTFLEDLKYVTGGWPLSQGYSLDLFWPEVMVRAREKGVSYNYFLGIDIRIDFNTSAVYLEIRPPPLEYYDINLWTEANSPKIVEIAEHWGNHSVSAAWEVKKTIEFAENLKKIVEKAHNATKNLTIEQQMTKISNLKNLHFPRIQWLQFLKNITGVNSLTEDDVVLLKIDGEEYFKDLYYLLQQTQNKFWANYIAIILVIEDCRYFTRKVETHCKEILKSLKKDSTRKDYCFDQAISEFDGVAEAQYIRKTVTKKKRKHIEEIITGIKIEMENNLRKNRWMDQQTKNAAVEHLRKIESAIGWTDIVFNETEFERLFGYSEFTLPSNNIVRMSHELNKLYLDYRFKKIKESFEFQIEHALSVPVLLEVNAFYVRYWDILMAPILHQPVYDLNRPEYLNYGALGSIIGHELTHAFAKNDEETRATLGKGTFDFWTNDTHKNYDIEKICIDEEYKRYAVELGIKLENGSASLDENLADFTGLNLAYLAYQKWVDRHEIENQLAGLMFTPNQLFWIMASTYMCLEPKLKDPEKAYTYPEKRAPHKHAFDSFRVVGPIRNSPYFGQDFGCSPGSKMNPEKKCRLFV